MRELPKISDAEWQVMKVLWKESPLNASQVINELQNYTTWSPKTIHTLLGRLADKGALNVDKSTTPYAYYPSGISRRMHKGRNQILFGKNLRWFYKKVIG